MIRRVCLLMLSAAVLPVNICVHAQQASIVKLTVEKKPGAHEGRATATVKGPPAKFLQQRATVGFAFTF
jgi:hypothetical protein